MNARIYCILLSLYPAELRTDFGAEMTQVFLEDLADSARTRGFFGAARVWRRSLKVAAQAVGVGGREVAAGTVVLVSDGPAGGQADGYRETWITYGTGYYSAKELTVLPKRSVTIKDGAAYGVILTQGHGTIGKQPVATPSMIRFGEIIVKFKRL